MPVDACNKYAHGLKMCLDNPVSPQKFDFDAMERREFIIKQCKFCAAGKDLDGNFKYGEN